MIPDALLPLVGVGVVVVAVRLLWWMLGDFVLDHVDLPPRRRHSRTWSTSFRR